MTWKLTFDANLNYCVLNLELLFFTFDDEYATKRGVGIMLLS
jgi:hypothetical protein